ncbi:MFS family permease [Dyadobacter sp. BE34]|uniref:MFS family permease n=1 Tax=Dyadobacter fermentans TaxID=94254 RepID=A0ABU1QRW4_9BACT|nr:MULTISPECIES: MFS transporter [Dyadobacter]MBZ1359203.1 MFS transporter [Dyadobacter fermentans]MDR6803906.1 MFS family permease [Dyadobacter fermentans]MDR7041646.1 MFS family permease [Dyadobacter sp. BE242]MDR7196049.1 MFS family permease [Dyadobacter sp. BE34]MDR7213406.1 MFS family permease [Dyadobacter sp. BE31]
MKTVATNDPYAALRYSDFRFFVSNSFLFSATIRVQEVIVGYELYKTTHDPLALGLVGLAEAIPFIVTSLFGGYVADQKNKITIMHISLVVILLGSGILYTAFQPGVYNRLAEWQHLAVIYAVFGLIGFAKGFYSPAASSLKPFLVPRAIYHNSSTWSSSFSQAGAIIGPAAAGFLYAYMGLTHTLLIVIVNFLICWVLLGMIKTRPEFPKIVTPIMESLKEGFKFVFKTRIVLYAMTLDLFSVLFGGVIALLPIFAEDILKVGPEGLGLLRAAPSIGSMLTMFAMAYFPPTHNAWRNMLVAVAGFGIFTLVFAASTNFMLSCGALFATGVFDSVSVIIRQTILQIYPPDEMRGRVAAVNGIFVSSSNELGAFESGVMAKAFGTVPSVMMGGMLTLVVVTWVYLRSKDLFSVKLS